MQGDPRASLGVKSHLAKMHKFQDLQTQVKPSQLLPCILEGLKFLKPVHYSFSETTSIPQTFKGLLLPTAV